MWRKNKNVLHDERTTPKYFLYALLVSYHHLYDFLKLCNKNQMYNFSIISKLNKTLRKVRISHQTQKNAYVSD
ncbi:hypothetical protein EI050_01680 [Escherichia coli]|nr:hypothetical protein [Escherichia coli]